MAIIKGGSWEPSTPEFQGAAERANCDIKDALFGMMYLRCQVGSVKLQHQLQYSDPTHSI